MSTEEQIAANRRNGGLSQGPQTEEGKATSARNSLKHGLLSSRILLADEDADVFSELAEGLRAELKPEGELEAALIERIIALTWRLRRIERIEAAMLAWERFHVLGDEKLFEGNVSYRTSAHEARLIAKREHSNSVASLGEACCKGADSLGKLSRYETSIERSLYKALHELERRQSARRGENVPPPLAVDINVTGLPERTEV